LVLNKQVLNQSLLISPKCHAPEKFKPPFLGKNDKFLQKYLRRRTQKYSINHCNSKTILYFLKYQDKKCKFYWGFLTPRGGTEPRMVRGFCRHYRETPNGKRTVSMHAAGSEIIEFEQNNSVSPNGQNERGRGPNICMTVRGLSAYKR